MTQHDATPSRFEARVLRPAQPGRGTAPAFVIFPEAVSSALPRRGRTTVAGTVDGHRFRATLEPDGRLGHWLPVESAWLEAAGVEIGDTASFEIRSVDEEPEPEVPADLREALNASPAARTTWDGATTLARLDWIHWVTAAGQAGTRARRIRDACDRLASGHRRVCCFDPSGFYSKAFRAPVAES